MSTNKSHWFPYLIIGGLILMFLASCKGYEPLTHNALIEGQFADIWEDSDGVHLSLLDESEILIEMQDEQEEYYFENSGKQQAIRYFRKDDGRKCIGVFVVLNDKLYQIDSHFYPLKP